MSSEGGQVRKNLIFNVLSLLANVAVGIFYTPYLVHHLGIVAYGILPLALIINQYINVVTGSLTSSLTRFYSIALQKGDTKEASTYLSTAIIAILFLIVLLGIPLWYFVANVNSVFTIPINLLQDTKSLFLYTIISFFFSLISSVFNITLYAFNRLDLLNVIKIVRVLGKFIFVFLLFNVLDVNVAYVGLANLITELVILVYSVLVFFRFSIGHVNLSVKYFSNKALTAVGILALWVIVQQIGDTGLYRVDSVIVNMFWSTKESGIIGAFTELGNYSMIVAGVLGSLFGPIILMAYSKDDHEKIQRVSLDSSLIVGVLVSVMIGVLIGFAPIILRIWLGEQFAPYSNWLILKLGLIPFYSAAGLFAFAARAWNKVMIPALITIALGGINFGVLYFLADYSQGDLSFVNIMLFVALVFGIAQSYFLNGFYFAYLYPGRNKEVLFNFIRIGVVLLSVSFIGSLLTTWVDGFSDVISLSLILVIAIILLAMSIYFSLNKRQLNVVRSLVKK